MEFWSSRVHLLVPRTTTSPPRDRPNKQSDTLAVTSTDLIVSQAECCCAAARIEQARVARWSEMEPTHQSCWRNSGSTAPVNGSQHDRHRRPFTSHVVEGAALGFASPVRSRNWSCPRQVRRYG